MRVPEQVGGRLPAPGRERSICGWVGTTADERAALARSYASFDPAWLATARPRRLVTLPPYRLDRHLVTNGEFATFVDAGGYRSLELWSAAGRAWLPRSARRCPRFWQSPRWSAWCAAEHPVVGVTCYEAEAYARFVGRRLPSEDEWELCANGRDGRTYPWGDEFHPGRANTADLWLGEVVTDARRWHESVIEPRLWRRVCMTTPVGQFPEGNGPGGHADLAGNVWEWCASAAPNGDRAVRGGSFAYMSWNARTSERGFHGPWWASLGIGFRCAEDVDHADVT